MVFKKNPFKRKREGYLRALPVVSVLIGKVAGLRTQSRLV